MQLQPFLRRNKSVQRVFVLFSLIILGASTVFASTSSISSTYKYAWSNVGGWVNFNPTNGGVTVTSTALTGYAWSANDGWINFSPTEGGVKNDGAGNLSGFAWDETAGWVDFSGVKIDAAGKFTGEATGGTVDGTSYALNFNCTNCNVVTTWRPSANQNQAAGSISPIYTSPLSTQPNSVTPSSTTSPYTPSSGAPLSVNPPIGTPPPPLAAVGAVGGGQTGSPSSFTGGYQTGGTQNQTNGFPSSFHTPSPTALTSGTSSAATGFLKSIAVPALILVIAFAAIFLLRFFL